MRIRSIKPDFFKDDELAALPALTRLLFIGLWCAADCEGRMEDRPARIRAEVLPYDDCDVDRMLDELHEHEFITRYTVGSRDYIEVRSFTKHQRISGLEAQKQSEFPATDHPEAVEKQPRSNGEAVEKRSLSRKGVRSTGREGKGTLKRVLLDRFWTLYPRRAGKGAAVKAWDALTDEEQEAALSAAEGFGKAWHGATADELRYCPHPATWLHQRRWEDDPAEWGPKKIQAQPSPERQRALIGSHGPSPSTPIREVDDDSPQWVRDLYWRIKRRDECSDEEMARYEAWLAGEAA